MVKPAALNVPLFRLVVEQLETAGRTVVLDLGAASTPMLSLLGQFRCRVEIADFAHDGGIERMNAEEDRQALAELADSLLPEPCATGEALDLVLCWDLPNYLNPAALSALMTAIAKRALPGSRAHALIAYSERSMPARPGRFIPSEDGKLVDQGRTADAMPAPRYSPEDLGRMMGGFSVERAVLLANGMQEFLLRLKG